LATVISENWFTISEGTIRNYGKKVDSSMIMDYFLSIKENEESLYDSEEQDADNETKEPFTVWIGHSNPLEALKLLSKQPKNEDDTEDDSYLFNPYDSRLYKCKDVVEGNAAVITWVREFSETGDSKTKNETYQEDENDIEIVDKPSDLYKVRREIKKIKKDMTCSILNTESESDYHGAVAQTS
jgi:hypothetical protein